MSGGVPCAHSTWRKPRASSACRPPSCASMPAKADLKRPSRASAGYSSKTTLPRISASFTLAAGKRR